MHQIKIKCVRNIAIHYLSQGWLLSTLIRWLISFSRMVFFSTHRLCHQLLMLAEWHFGPQPFSRHQCTSSSDSLDVWRGADAPNINMTTSSGFLSICYCAESILSFSSLPGREVIPTSHLAQLEKLFLNKRFQTKACNSPEDQSCSSCYLYWFTHLVLSLLNHWRPIWMWAIGLYVLRKTQFTVFLHFKPYRPQKSTWR